MAQARTTSREGEARIGSGARVRGRIQGEGDLLIEGHVEGDVALSGHLTVAEGASLTSEAVEAQAFTLAGSFEGELTATGVVRLGATARGRGTLRGSAVLMDDGARFSGRLDCDFELPPELGGTLRGDGRGRAAARR